MANPIWITGRGQNLVTLGTVTEGNYFEYPLDSYDPTGGSVTYKFLAGQLPPGIRINSAGYIQGGPYLDSVNNQSTSYTFTIRASDQHGLISDKSFTMTVNNINPPVIVTGYQLGQIFDGSYFNLQLVANELNPNATLTWSLVSGSLPEGLTLSSSGLLSGLVMPLSMLGNAGAQGFSSSPYNEFSFENSPKYQNNNYSFTVQVFDGANYATLTYKLTVVAKYGFTCDSTFNTIDNSYLTIDHDNVYSPIMTTQSQTLPEIRSNSKFAFQFQATDPSDNPLRYALSLTSSGAAGFDQGGVQAFDTTGFDQENLSVPPGLLMDPDTGWFTGTVGAQVEAIQSYTFQVYAFERDNPSRQSLPGTYNMVILGDITNTITWKTDSDLGSIDNGTISQLFVSATNKSGRALKYSLIGKSSLPQGLKLDASGLIIGKTGFEFFSLDKGTTKIDGQISGFDNSHTFTVQATTVDGTASAIKTFKILVNNFNLTPYEDLYIKALPTIDQRMLFLDIVNNTDIFPTELMYRPSDPNFGKARDIRSLFLAGIAPSEISSYLDAMSTNTYTKRIDFGNIKTAIAVDENFNTKYEVVYISLENDYAFNETSPLSVYDKKINRYVYTNSYANMSKAISSNLGYANISALPDWMTSPQADKKQLGFTRAIVLAYTVPGASNLIAYRLGANGISFNDINFVVDRYDLDNSYSANYNINTKSYDLGRETTFDRIQRPGVVVANASYGITGIPFNKIHNQTVAQINSLGGLDGVTDFKTGDTVVFLQQENYPNQTSSYDGWILNNTLVPGWNDFVNSAKYLSSTTAFPYNPHVGQVALVNNVYYMFVTELDSGGNVIDTVWKVANLRAGVWTINIDSNNVVTLTPTTFIRNVGDASVAVRVSSMIMPSDRVQINYGKTRSETIVFYNPSLQPGQSVPAYTSTQTILSTTDKNTRFDGYGTRFINNRITYEDPESGDVWLKFPSNGPLL